jgi:predicted ATPase
MLINSVYLHREDQDTYPFYLPIFHQRLCFPTPVTIIVGENGCGKSTFLELLGAALSIHHIGKPLVKVQSIRIDMDYVLKKPKGLLFSSEDFTSYIHQLQQVVDDSQKALEDIQDEYKNKSTYSKLMAGSAHHRTIHEVKNLHDRDLLQSSHGQAYLSFFKSRIRTNQLYLLDEIETPLSFTNQLAILYLIKAAVDAGNQLIISTHSPVIMAYPNATIYQLDEEGFHPITFQEAGNVGLMKQFLENPEAFTHHLFQEDTNE